MFKVKEGILLGGKQITGDGPTEVLTTLDVGDMAFQDSSGVTVDSIAATSADITTLTADSILTSAIQTIWVPASAMTPNTTNGAVRSDIETTTNDIMLPVLSYDAATQKSAQFQVRMPKGWDEGTVTLEFVWTHPATTTNFNVVWGCKAVALSNGAALDTAPGTAVTVTDTGGTTDYLYVSDATSAMTIGNTPIAEDWVAFVVYRDAAAGGDTLAVDARLLGVTVNYTIDTLSDA
jgi:hypothetical protein